MHFLLYVIRRLSGRLQQTSPVQHLATDTREIMRQREAEDNRKGLQSRLLEAKLPCWVSVWNCR